METINLLTNFTLGLFTDHATGIPMARITASEPDGTRVPITGFFPCTQDEALVQALLHGYAINGHEQVSPLRVTYYPLALLEG